MTKPIGVLTLLSLLISVFLGCSPSKRTGNSAGAVTQDTTNHSKSTERNGQETNAGIPRSPERPASNNSGKLDTKNSEPIVFKDTVRSNVKPPSTLDELVFTDKNGDSIALRDFKGRKNVVLVFTEGFNGILCPFCQTQTSRLIANYDKFTEQDAEILVVYPGKRDHVDEFIETALNTEKQQVDMVPFPIVLDEDFAATDFFAIRRMRSHPATFVIDKNGTVQLAYVGQDMTADRPSVQAILDKLKSVNQ